MHHAATIETYPEYLRVEVTGERDPGTYYREQFRTWSQIFRTCRDHDVLRILSVHDMHGRVPLEALAHLGDSLDAMGWHPDIRWAAVERGSALAEACRSLGVRERCAVDVRFFDDEGTAVDWLLSL